MFGRETELIRVEGCSEQESRSWVEQELWSVVHFLTHIRLLWFEFGLENLVQRGAG
jgi:hypothetical protein